jgi:hypothetical protein
MNYWPTLQLMMEEILLPASIWKVAKGIARPYVALAATIRLGPTASKINVVAPSIMFMFLLDNNVVTISCK